MSKLPNLRQPEGSCSCGPYCVKMILSALSKDLSIKKIEELCEQYESGTLEPGLALGLLNTDTKATLYVAPDGDTIRTDYLHKKPAFIARSMRRRAADYEETMKVGFQQLAKVVDEGAVIFDFVTGKTIEQKIDEGCVWIAGVAVAPFYYERVGEVIGSYHHFVVIEDYTDTAFVVNDPDFELENPTSY